jgi:hypothetical protein
MPSPSASQVHINRLLTNLSVAYLQNTNKFAALRMFPGVNVQNRSDKYAIYSQADFLRDEMEERAPATESAGTGWTFSTDQYQVRRYAVHVDIDNDTVANQDGPINVQRDTAAFLGQKVLIKLETLFGTKFFTTSIWTGGIKANSTAGDLVAGTDFVAWSDITSTPIEDVTAQMANIESQTGYVPNKLAITRKVWNALKLHPDIIDRIKYTSSASVTPELVARLMELDEIVIGAGVRNTAARGLTGSYGYVMGNNALLAYVPPTASQQTPTAGLTFRWTGLPGNVDGSVVTEFDLPLNKARRYEVEMNIDMKVVAPALGAFFQNAA